MTAAELLERLDGVRERGPGRWSARCPAHADNSPSLGIRELDDGTILLHDFAGCDALSVCHAIGIEFRDLFPAGRICRVEYHGRQRQSASAALAALDHEARVIGIIGADFLAERSIDRETWSRLARAVALIGDARVECCFVNVPARE